MTTSKSPIQPSLTSRAIRQRFFDFFAERSHAVVPASPVVPLDDPTLLFTNAGMNQFKDVFLGTGRRDYVRAANSQKCIRAGGKHNDLDDVGHDTYHHTFFEMLGSWSFGDYFKEDAIRWAWQLLHGEWGIPAERLHATYFAGDEQDGLPADQEAKELWLDVTGIEASRVHPFGKKDNFWEMAETGPCGPCTEIHVDLTLDLSGGPLVNADDARVFEVWNLVFIQFNRDGDGSLHQLPAQHVDTGMGFERLVTVLQGKTSNYDTDVFGPLMEAIRAETGAKPYAASLPARRPSDDEMRDMTYRILADHVRCLSFAIADGALPDNLGRGHVLRRILRRAYRYGRQYLGVDRPFLHNLVPAVSEQMGDVFPELRENESRVREAIHEEEESFARTLDSGLKLFAAAATRAQDAGSGIDGETAFRLHDTYGFPIDLTKIIATERGLPVDEAGYQERMEEAKKRAREAGRGAEGDDSTAILEALAKVDAAVFERAQTDDLPKFQGLEHASEVVGFLDRDGAFHEGTLEPGRAVGLVLRSTCFYAEQGGQIGDRGEIRADGGLFEVSDTQRAQNTVLHIGHLVEGTLAAGDPVAAAVTNEPRRAIMANHTATHLLNHGLREILGDHVQQRGSLVDSDKTRFDFSHRSSLSGEEIRDLEAHVGRQISEELAVHAADVPLKEAMAVHSLRAVFGEKYPDVVRVVSIGVPVEELLAAKRENRWAGYSIELCGGTHVAKSSDCEAFAVLSEEPVAKGVRRLVAVTGVAARRARALAGALGARAADLGALEGEKLRAGLAELLADIARAPLPLTARQDLQGRIEALQSGLRQQQKERAAAEGAEVQEVAETLLDASIEVGGTRIIVGAVPAAPPEKIREAIDWLRQKSGSAAVVLFSGDSKVVMLAGLTGDLVKRGHDAKGLLREAGTVVGGGGGGRPDLAQGGAKKPEKVPEAVEHLKAWLSGRLADSAT
ncbi:MAG: alanine--tRNA ligase [Acidobacteriota bacterium]